MVAFSMSVIPKNPKLAHLSADEIDSLISRYYSKLPIAPLLAQYRIDCSSSQLFAILPPVLSSELCPNCGNHMVQLRLSRSSYRDENKYGLHCLSCKHREKYCKCTHCRHKKKENIKSDIRIVKAATNGFQKTTRQIRASNLSLGQAISLFALIWRYAPSKAKSFIPLDVTKLSNTSFAPDGTYRYDLICHLVDAGLIVQSDHALSTGFSIQQGELLTAKVSKYNFSNEISAELISDLEELIGTCNWPVQWYEQLSDVAIELAIAECTEFFYCCASARRFPRINEKPINAMIRNVLEDFTIGQSFRIIQSGAQYAADFLVRNDSTPSIAAHYMIEASQHFANKARQEHWSLKALPRNAKCPRSIISMILYDFILQGQPTNQGLDLPIALLFMPD